MTRGMNNGRKLKMRRYTDLVKENQRLKEELKALQEENYRLMERLLPPTHVSPDKADGFD